MRGVSGLAWVLGPPQEAAWHRHRFPNASDPQVLSPPHWEEGHLCLGDSGVGSPHSGAGVGTRTRVQPEPELCVSQLVEWGPVASLARPQDPGDTRPGLWHGVDRRPHHPGCCRDTGLQVCVWGLSSIPVPPYGNGTPNMRESSRAGPPPLQFISRASPRTGLRGIAGRQAAAPSRVSPCRSAHPQSAVPRGAPGAEPLNPLDSAFPEAERTLKFPGGRRGAGG